ncbi:oxygen-insensitive NADPH nitroreductase [Paenibacillus hamazuiensis]|uniref:oxygen-insensitive NADPH nitroreductase n=1 Tax=Paenibacillus hamazuiensis TaxID=2936508 RepID=UPI00200ED760|nr:oxygen-insensitive NADPH nitroreductase [Paenibacillus hamazuiensis]
MNPVVQLLQGHRSIRKFTQQNIDREQIEAIVRSAQMASTSSNVQAYSIIGVTDQAMKDELAALSGMAYVASCPLFLVWCADLHRLRLACEKQQTEMVHGLLENFIVATVDAALASQNAAIAAESMGLGIVYIGSLRNKPLEVSRLLKLPELVYPVFGMCVGYPDQEPSVRPRLPMAAVYHENTYNDERYGEALDVYDETMKQYYLERTGGKKSTTWTQEMAAKYEKAVRAHMRSFIEEMGFRLD